MVILLYNFIIKQQSEPYNANYAMLNRIATRNTSGQKITQRLCKRVSAKGCVFVRRSVAILFAIQLGRLVYNQAHTLPSFERN